MATLDLLAAVRQGDAAAAENLIHRYESILRRLVRLRLTDPKLRRVFDSIDICQSVLADFLAAAERPDFQVNGEKHLISLLAKMAAHKIIDRARHEARNAGSLPSGWDPVADTPPPSQTVALADEIQKYCSLMT